MMAVWVALGGAAGALARWGLGGWVQAWAGAAFPWGTFTVNGVGCFLIGAALPLLDATAASQEVRTAVVVGLLGAFTTFSTYSLETVALLRDGDWARAMAYALGSVVVGLVAVATGLVAASWGLQARG